MDIDNYKQNVEQMSGWPKWVISMVITLFCFFLDLHIIEFLVIQAIFFINIVILTQAQKIGKNKSIRHGIGHALFFIWTSSFPVCISYLLMKTWDTKNMTILFTVLGCSYCLCYIYVFHKSRKYR